MKTFTEKINENQLISYNDALKNYIIGQKIVEVFSLPEFNKIDDIYVYGEGFILENNYKWVSHGGGCSGEDCNVSFIIAPNGELVAKIDW